MQIQGRNSTLRQNLDFENAAGPGLEGMPTWLSVVIAIETVNKVWWDGFPTYPDPISIPTYYMRYHSLSLKKARTGLH